MGFSLLSQRKERSKKVLYPLLIYKRGRSFLSSFLSNDGFVSHYYSSSVVASICLLSCCHFPEMGHLASKTELIKDGIMAVGSFRLTLHGLSCNPLDPCVYTYLQMTFARLSELIYRERASPRRPGCYLYLFFQKFPCRGYIHLV